MALHNPNNWHWVNKDVSAWTKTFLESDLVGISAEEGGAKCQVSKILSNDGDCDVSQRKGKVITIFDLKIQLEYTGSTKDGEDVSGTISIPEVAHDSEEDDYVFEVELYSESSEKQPVKDLVKSKITPQLRTKFQALGPLLIAEHGKDLQHGPDHKPAIPAAARYQSNSSSHINGSSKSSSTAAQSSTTSTTTNKGSSVNVTSLTDQTEFRTTAAELYQTFTDPQRIAAFTRSPPKVFEGAHEGAAFEFFGGNISGSYTKLQEPTCIEQKWRLATWPQGHYSLLKIKFEQNDVDSVTIMRVDWSGVPIGQEEPTKRNWGEYYVKSIKTTFGFGTIL